MASCHIVLFPFTPYGHTIPMADMAVLFASRGLQTTIIVTPSTAHRFSKTVHKTINCRHQIALHIINCKEIIEPDSNENISAFFEPISLLQQPFENFIKESKPNCIISDMFYPWTTKIASKYNIPRIIFNGTGYFSLCVSESIIRLHHDPSKSVSSDSEQRFLVPHLPHEIMLTKKQLPHLEGEHFKEFLKVLIQAMEAEVVSYGVIMNSFYVLEPDYVRHYREVMKRNTWHIGPVSLCWNNNTLEDSFERGMKSDIDEHDCLKWLKSKRRDSVVYVCFGTMVTVSSSQLHEIAMGLEACNQDFIWVIKKDQEMLIPKEFEARMKANEKGLIIKGWAPQMLILDHESVGGFVTHCGWNSVLEGVCAGVAMVTWPVMAEQFYNEKLVTDVLKVGVSIGDVGWSATSTCEGVTRDAIEKALAMVMVAEGGEEMRIRARVLKEKAKSAVKEGGSSYSSLTGFIEEIKAYK